MNSSSEISERPDTQESFTPKLIATVLVRTNEAMLRTSIGPTLLETDGYAIAAGLYVTKLSERFRALVKNGWGSQVDIDGEKRVKYEVVESQLLRTQIRRTVMDPQSCIQLLEYIVAQLEANKSKSTLHRVGLNNRQAFNYIISWRYWANGDPIAVFKEVIRLLEKNLQ